MGIDRYWFIVKRIYDLKRKQYANKNNIINYPTKKLKNIIDHAYKNVPYYNKLLKNKHLCLDDIKNLEDINKIPLTNKTDVRDSKIEDVMSKGTIIKECHTERTSGSTGIPLEVLRTNKDMDYRWAKECYVLFECGGKINDKIVFLRAEPMKKYWFQKLGILRTNSVIIRQTIPKIIDELSEEKPDVLDSFPSVYLLLSNHIKESGINPRIGLSSGENLSKKMRETINSAYDIELFQDYSSTEFGRIAFECKEHEGMHIISDDIIVEFIKDGENVSAGEEGEIVITALHNYGMPIIRYRMGDIGILSDENCNCGRTIPMIERIEGRTDDYIKLPSGKVISPRSVNILEWVYGINEFQIVQEKIDKIVVLLVKGKNFSEKTIVEVMNYIKSGCFDEPIDVEVKIVDSIERGRAGKIRNVVSKL